MFSRKKKPPVAKEKPKRNVGMDFGLGIPGMARQASDDDAELEAELFALTGKKCDSDDIEFGGGEDDDDLEAELAKILGKKPVKKSDKPTMPPPSVRKNINLQKGGSIEFGSDIDDEEVDENDPELLGELAQLTTDDTEIEEADEEEEEEEKEIKQLDLVRSRLEMYKNAEAKAKADKETSRARRFNRGVKTLEKLLKRVEGGEMVPYTEIPPEVATNLKPAPPLEPAQLEHTQPSPENLSDLLPPMEPEIVPMEPELPSTEKLFIPQPDYEPNPAAEPEEPAAIEEVAQPKTPEIVLLLHARKDEYKKFALASKKSGNMAAALDSVRMIKVCDKLINDSLVGKTVEKSEIPPVPRVDSKNPPPKIDVQKTIKPDVPFVSGEIFSIPKTILEALNQRLVYYEKALRKAETTGARNDITKLGGIVKIYQNAIRLHQKGTQLPYEKLPTPPGCPPIPIAFKI